jgi:hypothetical protein
VGERKGKKGLLDKLDVLDKKAEVSLLPSQKVDLRQCLHNRLTQPTTKESGVEMVLKI